MFSIVQYPVNSVSWLCQEFLVAIDFLLLIPGMILYCWFSQFLGILLPSIFLFLIEKNPGILTNLEEKAVKTSEDELHGVFGEKSIYTVAQR